MKRLGVYCGSVNGHDEKYAMVARRLGHAMAMAGLGLVYGGGTNGLMGQLALSVMSADGHLTGIMPRSLVPAEGAYRQISDYREVDSFHHRKHLMSALSDGLIVLPGGPGTLEELMEQLHWKALGYHTKPIIIINTDDFWNDLLTFLSQIPDLASEQFVVVDGPEAAVAIFQKMTADHRQLCIATSSQHKKDEYAKFGIEAIAGPDLQEVLGTIDEVITYKILAAPPFTLVEDTVLKVGSEEIVDVKFMATQIAEHGEASWITSLGYRDDKHLYVYCGTIPGRITTPTINLGPSFEPYFVPAGTEMNLYELRLRGQKDQYSARRLAIEAYRLDKPQFVKKISDIPRWAGEYQKIKN